MKHIYKIIALILLFSCSKDFLDRDNPSQITTDTYYTTEQHADAAILAAYNALQSQFLYKSTFIYLSELPSDDAVNKEGASSQLNMLTWTSDDSQLIEVWTALYNGIYCSNLVLEKVPSITMNEEKKKNIIGEAYFLRGLYFWHLANVYGNAPIITSVPKDVKSLPGNSSYEELLEQSAKDLKSSIELLPDAWDDSNKGRITKMGATAFLGKTYLYQQKWSEAIVEFLQVVNSGKFKLLSNYRSVFSRTNEYNDETIFEISFVDNGNGSFGTDFSSANEGSLRDLIMGPQNVGNQRNYGGILATYDLFGEFEQGDSRLKESLYYPFDWGGKIKYDTMWYSDEGKMLSELYYTSYIPSPYRDKFHIKKAVSGYYSPYGDVSDNNWRMFRYADLLLMLSEAYCEIGDFQESAKYLNKVRQRAIDFSKPNNFSLYTIGGFVDTLKYDLMLFPYYASGSSGREFNFINVNLKTLREAIVHERRVELAFEYHRFFDLKRWQRLDENHPGAAVSVFKNKFYKEDKLDFNKSIHINFPLPASEVELSGGKIKQNPGY